MFNLLLRIGTAILRDQMSGSQAFYAVRNGRNPGVYRTWDECRDQVNKYSNAQFKKFRTQEEAYQFMSSQGGRASPPATSTYRRAPAASPSSSYTAASSSYSYTAASPSYSYQGGSSAYTGRRSGYQARPFPYMRKRSLSPAASVQAASIDIEHQSPKRARYVDTNFNERESTSISGFTYKDGAAVVYTDGCCTDNGFQSASAGIGVYWGPGHERNVSAKLPGRQTNNRAEIHAARQAIESAKEMGLAKISLHTDSQFLINGVTKWIHGWKKNGWKLSTGKPVQNKEDFQSLDSALQGIDVQWVHVRGHVGIPGNEAADGLAREGSRKSLEDRGALRN